MHSRRVIAISLLLGAPILGGIGCQNSSSRPAANGKSGVIIDKRPANFVTRTFDPANPPADMPPLAPPEAAECDSVFQSSANVGGETRQTDATHAGVTVTSVKVTLQLNVTIWLPTGATQHIVEHENGHRQISEAYYQTADKLAERIAATYLGRQINIAGPDLDAESKKALQQTATDITEEYGKELDPEPAQLLFESITNHGTNDVVARDAAAHSLKNVGIESAQPTAP